MLRRGGGFVPPEKVLSYTNQLKADMFWSVNHILSNWVTRNESLHQIILVCLSLCVIWIATTNRFLMSLFNQRITYLESERQGNEKHICPCEGLRVALGSCALLIRKAQTSFVATMHLPRRSVSWGSPRRAGRRAMAGLCGWCGQSLQGWWRAAHGPCVREGTPRSDVCGRRTGWSDGRSEPAGSRRHIMLLAKTRSFQENGRRVNRSSPCTITSCHLKIHSSAVYIKGLQK